MENVSVLVVVGADDTGHREVIGVAEGIKEDCTSWEQFIKSLIKRGLKGVRLMVGDRCTVARFHRERDAARREMPAVHGPLHACQGQPQAHGMGIVDVEGCARHGITRRHVEQDRGMRPARWPKGPRGLPA